VFSEVEAYMESLLTSRNSTVEAYNHTAAVNNALEGQIHQLEREVQVLRLRVQEQEKSAQRRHRDRCQEMIKDRVERLNQDLAQAQQAQKEVDERNNRLREQAGQLVEERGKLMAVLSVSPAQLPAPYFNPVVQMIEAD
jgi:predicted RNase H-like nuclease (RuvC/YqgF family)